MRAPPHHSNLDLFSIETYGFGDPPFQETVRAPWDNL